MSRALAFALILVCGVAPASAQQCTNWTYVKQNVFICAVWLANGYCKVGNYVPQTKAFCTAVNALNTAMQQPYRPLPPPPRMPVYNYVPPRLPYQLQPYFPNYPNYGSQPLHPTYVPPTYVPPPPYIPPPPPKH